VFQLKRKGKNFYSFYKMTEQDIVSLTEISTLFSLFDNLEAVAQEVATDNDICFDDLYVYTASDIVIRSLLDYITKSDTLYPLLLQKLDEGKKPLVEKFVSFTKKDIHHSTRSEVLALRELSLSYGNDYWQWVKDAFDDSTEYVGSELEEYTVADIQTATLQIVCNFW
jgi:hypothetical protein